MKTPRYENSQHPTPEYLAWANMKRRCRNPNHPSWPGYGGRGIVVCDEWKSYDNFLRDMGRKPSPIHTLERLDNERGYYKGNCIWATNGSQSRNKRTTVPLTIDGITACTRDWCRFFGINPGTYSNRVKRSGMEPEQALKAPVQKHWKKKFGLNQPVDSPTTSQRTDNENIGRTRTGGLKALS